MRRSGTAGNVLRFGTFELDSHAGELRKGKTPIKLPPQPLKVLAMLASRPGELVSREEVQRALWNDNTFVDVGQGLGTCVAQIRSALSDSARNPRYVETLPRRGYRFIAPVEGLPARKHMVAVLPFANLSGNPEDDYFCDGLTEEIIAELASANSETLEVIGRTSVLRFKDTTKDIAEIAAQLGVEYVLEGSVRRYAEQVRITAQLVEVRDCCHLWAKTYQRRVDDVLGLQDEIARKIAEAIDIKVGHRSSVAAGRPRHSDSRAYEAYLKGRFFWNKRTEHDIQRAIQFFREAIDIEPDYALGYSGLADAYHMLGSSYVASSMSPRDAFPNAHAAALRALEIDDGLAEAHASLAAVLGGYQWDWEGWARECRKAIELNESYSTAHQWYAESLAAVGRHDEALAAIHRAQQIDPLSAAVNATAAWILYFARRYEFAEEQCRKTLEVHPDFASAHLYLGFVLEQTGRFKEALRQFKLAVEFSCGTPESVAAPGHTYALLGRRAKAKQVLTALRKLSRQRYVSSYLVAKICAALGENDEAFASLQSAVEERSDWLLFVDVDPCLDPLRSDPRFLGLRHSVNLS